MNENIIKKESLNDIVKLASQKPLKKFETIHLKADFSILSSPRNHLKTESSLPSTKHQSQQNSIQRTIQPKFRYKNLHNNLNTTDKKINRSTSKDAKPDKSTKHGQPLVRKANTDTKNEQIRKRLSSAGKSTKFTFLRKEENGSYSVKNKDNYIKLKRFEFTNMRNTMDAKNSNLNETVSSNGTNATLTGKSGKIKSLRSSFFTDIRPRNPHQPGNIKFLSTASKPPDANDKKPPVPRRIQNTSIARLNKQNSSNSKSKNTSIPKAIVKLSCENTGCGGLPRTISPKKILLLTDLEDDEASPKTAGRLDPKYILFKYSKYLRPNEIKEIESNTEGIYIMGLIERDSMRNARYLAKSVHNSFRDRATLSSRQDHKKSLNITKDEDTTTFLDSYDDKEGDYMIAIGDHINYRYEIISNLGKGSFGQAIKCFDHKIKEYVCVKIIKNKIKFYNQALIEIRILEHLTRNDPTGQSNIVKYYTNFIFRNHICIVFELLDMNLYELLKEQDFKGLELQVIRKLAIQLLYTLLFMKRNHIIHCDLKPENVLLKQWGKTGIKVIDFGSSCFEDEKMYTYIQSRFYRAPEIILGQGYGIEIDMWSFGSILCELFTGIPIFPGENERDQLYYIMEYLGVPSSDYLQISRRCSVFFDSNEEPYKVPNSRGKIRLPNTKSFSTFLQGADEDFIDFIQKCLQWNPEDRLKPGDALMHPWIIYGMPKDILSFHKKSIDIVNGYQSSPMRCENGASAIESESKLFSSREYPAASMKSVHSGGSPQKCINIPQSIGNGGIISQIKNRKKKYSSMDTETNMKIKKNQSANILSFDGVKPKIRLTLDIHINIKNGSNITASRKNHKNNLSKITKDKQKMSVIDIQENYKEAVVI